jgi:hypothetical protein
MFSVFLGNKDMPTIGAAQSQRAIIDVGSIKSFIADFAEILPPGTIIFIYVLMRSTTTRA